MSGCGFYAYNAGSGMGRYAYTDNSAFSLGSIPGSASAGTSANVGWYKFTGCYEPIACAKVSGLHASNIGPWTCTLTWSDSLNSGASYTVVTLPDSTVLASGITDTTGG